MTKTIQIICTKPGMRRVGVEHPASATYEEGRWTKEQLEILKADPSFVVQEINEHAMVTKSDDFDKAVAAQVEAQLKAKVEALEKNFGNAVQDAAAEKVRATETELAIANARIAELETEIKKSSAAKPVAKK